MGLNVELADAIRGFEILLGWSLVLQSIEYLRIAQHHAQRTKHTHGLLFHNGQSYRDIGRCRNVCLAFQCGLECFAPIAIALELDIYTFLFEEARFLGHVQQTEGRLVGVRDRELDRAQGITVASRKSRKQANTGACQKPT